MNACCLLSWHNIFPIITTCVIEVFLNHSISIENSRHIMLVCNTTMVMFLVWLGVIKAFSRYKRRDCLSILSDNMTVNILERQKNNLLKNEQSFEHIHLGGIFQWWWYLCMGQVELGVLLVRTFQCYPFHVCVDKEGISILITCVYCDIGYC